jgi:glycosyltransferase involved in cell wall biosynthesis
MRITYVGPVPPFRGAIAQHGARLAEALTAAGHRVEVHSWAAQYPRLLYPQQERDPEAAPLPGARFALRWWSPLSWWRAGRAARAGDLLAFQWVTPVQAPAYRVMLAAAGRVPGVAIVHNPLPHERRWFDVPLTRWALGRARGAVVHASSSQAELAELLPGLPSTYVPMPTLLPDVRPTDLPPGPPYRLLFFGFVRPYKGLDIALEAMAELVARGLPVRLTVAGEFWGPVEPWRDSVAAKGLGGVVDLRPGYLGDADAAALLAAHHLVVAPYRSATQSGIVPVAYAAGRPVAATSVGGLVEQVIDGETGTLAPPDDPKAFAAAVERSLGVVERLAAGARAHTASWPDVAAAVIGLAPVVSKRNRKR